MSIALQRGNDITRLENVLLTECETEWDVESYASIATVRMSSAPWADRIHDALRYLVDYRVLLLKWCMQEQSNSFTLAFGVMRFGDVSGAGQNATAHSENQPKRVVCTCCWTWSGSDRNDDTSPYTCSRRAAPRCRPCRLTGGTAFDPSCHKLPCDPQGGSNISVDSWGQQGRTGLRRSTLGQTPTP